jgi:hypothetical protein
MLLPLLRRRHVMETAWIAALAVVALVSGPASAQDEKNQLGGIVGGTFISNEGIKGATFSNSYVSATA